jgi:hypothetical protein
LINKIALKFTKLFYKEQFEEEDDNYRIIWNADIGFWPVVICDEYYFSIDEIITLLNNNWHTNIIKDYYNFWLEQSEKNQPTWISFYNYGRKQTLISDIIEKERQEDLKQSKKAVKNAKKLLTDYINNTKKWNT